MKIEKIVCDRCGKDIVLPVQVRYTLKVANRWIENGHGSFIESEVDLCEDCQDKLKEWLENGTEEL